MKKFEVGKRYNDESATFEVLSRTKKTVTVAYIHHPGRFNERMSEAERKKIYDWKTEEVFYWGCYEVHAL